MADIYFLRKIRRVRYWRETTWGQGERSAALEEIYDSSVRNGGGLSLWKVASKADESAVYAIMAELSKARLNTADYFRISAAQLEELGFCPQPTPHNTTSCHKRAKELHHDLVGLSEEDCERLRDHLRSRYPELHVRITKAELKRYIREQLELASFQDPEVQTRLETACGPK